MSSENRSNKASAEELTERQAPTKCSIPQKGRLGNFPHRLFSLLECAETKEDDGRTIAWTRDGMAFDVFQPKELMEEVDSKWLPGPSIFRAFERQLSNWGFRMITFLPINEPSCSIQHLREGPPWAVRRYWHLSLSTSAALTTVDTTPPTSQEQVQQKRQSLQTVFNDKSDPCPEAVPAVGSMETGRHFLVGSDMNKTFMISAKSQREDKAQIQKVRPLVSLLPGMGHECFFQSCMSCPFTDRIDRHL